MVLGTSSGAGKSLMTAALCRVLLRRGEQPLPFKGQNMSLNAWVDGQGGEMAYSQALQAWAARLEPAVCMNPVLLKPQGNSTSEVIHLGRSAGICKAENYYRDWFRPGWQAIRSGLGQLKQGHPDGRLVLEGAGSPVEMNLQHRDLTNLRLAQFLRARCLLVADIERGGVFAQIVGTLSLLRPVERSLFRGLLINRFRGRRSLFDDGRHWLETRTGLPVFGVMPWLDELFPPEDSLDLLERRGRKRGAELEIAVLRLPALSNFSDLDPLEAEATVQLRWIHAGSSLGRPDAVLLPGSKQTLADLRVIRASGLGDQLVDYVAAGGVVFGLCGGMQMLGRELYDPHGLEGGERSAPGLGLLPLRTVFEPRKILRRRCLPTVAGAGLPPHRSHEFQSPAAGGETRWMLEGFELHQGHSELMADGDPRGKGPPTRGATSSSGGAAASAEWLDSSGVGWQSGSVAGTYLHSIFDNGPWRRRWLNALRSRCGLPSLPEQVPHHGRHREALLDRLADAFEEHVDLSALLAS